MHPPNHLSTSGFRPAAWNALVFRVAVWIAWVAGGSSLATEGPGSRTREERVELVNRATPRLKEGDIIFISINYTLYRKIAETSQSWESHVGIVFRNASGAWTMAESTFPVARFTPLESFLEQSKYGRFVVCRLRDGLSQEEARRLRESAESRMGKLYHTGFNYDSPRLYCSKFVYDCYLESTGHRIGRIESFREVLQGNPAAPLGFWRLWFLGSIPWDRRTVTTASQLRSPELATVFDSEKATR